MDHAGFRETLEKLYDAFPTYASLVMGILLLCLSAVGIYNDISDGTYTILTLSSWLIMMASGVFIVIVGRKDQVKTIGLYAISLGLTRVIVRCTAMDFNSFFSIAINFFPLLLAINLIYTGSHFALGRVIRRTSMMFTAIILALLDLVMLIFPGLMPPSRDPVAVSIECIMYFLLILILDTEQIRYGTSIGEHVMHLDRIRNSYRLDTGTFITPDVANNLMFRSGNLWTPMGDGVVEKEMTFVVVGDNTDIFITAQIWVGKTPMYLTVQSEQGSIIRANRLAVDHVKREGDKLHFYGKDGTDFRLSVKEVSE